MCVRRQKCEKEQNSVISLSSLSRKGEKRRRICRNTSIAIFARKGFTGEPMPSLSRKKSSIPIFDVLDAYQASINRGPKDSPSYPMTDRIDSPRLSHETGPTCDSQTPLGPQLIK